jgi:ribosome modulation factor
MILGSIDQLSIPTDQPIRDGWMDWSRALASRFSRAMGRRPPTSRVSVRGMSSSVRGSSGDMFPYIGVRARERWRGRVICLVVLDSELFVYSVLLKK